MARLNKRQLRWVDEYLACGDATLAAERAGYDGKTRHVLSVTGSRNLAHAGIRAELERRGGTSSTAATPSKPAAPKSSGKSAGDGVPGALDLPTDPLEALRVLATSGGLHSSARIEAFKYLDRRDQERRKQESGRAPMEKLMVKRDAAFKSMRARERETGCCLRCHQPLPPERRPTPEQESSS